MEIWKVALQAIGIVVAIAALGWKIATFLIKNPKLRLTLLDPRSQLTRFGETRDAPLTHFYHLNVKNTRNSIANNVRIKLSSVTREATRSEQRSWVFFIWAARPQPNIYSLDISGLDEQVCNLGYIIQGQDFFLDVCDPARAGENYKWPAHFDGYIRAGETVYLDLVAVANNAKSKPLTVKISWDGQWH